MSRLLATYLGVVSVLFFSAAAATAGSISVIDLGIPSGFTTSAGREINSNGDIAVQSGATVNAFHWSGGTYTANLGNLSATYNYAYPRDINNSGVVVGTSKNANNKDHAYKWTAEGGIVDLGAWGATPASKNSRAASINNKGDIVGDSEIASSSTKHAFIIYAGTTTLVDLGTVTGGTASYAYKVNDSGQVAGMSITSSGNRAFRYSGGTMQDLGVLNPEGLSAGLHSTALSINTKGDVVGQSAGTGWQHAYLWTEEDGMIDLGADLTVATVAEDINDRGEIVGELDVYGTIHAFYYSEATGILDLNDLIVDGSGWVLQYAMGINNSGMITGWGTKDGAVHGYVLTIPEPSTLALLGCGLIGLLAYAWRKRR